MHRVFRNLATAGALVLAGMAAAVAADPAPDGTNAQVADSYSVTRILTRLRTTPSLHSFDFVVTVDGGGVVLGGAVSSVAARELAGRIVADTRGIESVDNRIHVDASAVPREPSSAVEPERSPKPERQTQ